MKNILPQALSICATACVLALVTGCKTESQSSAPAAPAVTQAPVAPAPAVSSTAPSATITVPVPTATAASAQVTQPIRIQAAATEGFTDKNGNKWAAATGFADGETIERPDITVTVGAGDDQKIYQSERYSMTKFTQALPNGKYIVKLHFCETYEGISGAGERVFSYKVQDNPEVKDFDVFAKAGGAMKAYVDTQTVNVTNGMLTITFSTNVENPEINAIELIPQM
jgi:hypothetical protein